MSDDLWYADRYQQIIKQVSPKWVKQHHSWYPNLFSTREAAIKWKREQLAERLELCRKAATSAERDLKKFEKKFGWFVEAK